MRETRNGRTRRSVLKRIAGGAAAGTIGVSSSIGFSGPGAADESEDHYHNPTGPIGFGDVTVLRTCDGTYYAYGTETPEDVVPIARSEDLVNWTYIGSAFESQPDWRDDPDAGVWAPTIDRYDGAYRLYYSYSTWGSQNNPGIGLATAETPEGPFEDQGPVFRAEDLSVTNAIDPDFLLVDGTPYMVWGSWYGLYAVELTADGRDFVPGTEFQLAGDMKEGPMILEENGYYYLFYSTGHCCDGYDSTYELEVGRSESFFGPYTNQNGDDLRELNEHHSGVSVLTGTDRFVGPGHNTAIEDDDGDWWMIYHAEATTEYSTRVMMVDRIQWDEDDWPVVGDGGTPSTESPMPVTGRDECDGESGGDGDGDDDTCTDSAQIDGRTVCDVDGDGHYRDVTGDGSVTQSDVVEYFQNLSEWDERADLFDYTDDGRVSQTDVVDLFEYVADR
ncbi:family 43 glycosylhydrolase [Halomontanus rarus]|uniref:family 43 glycosylhydrolase n=1 Tax=Halomontanus rarus TaxID=3034020 RepID=UPI0023E880CB|nr:family 43 glycosylhydrolase [Halovivax sp. TS33]